MTWLFGMLAISSAFIFMGWTRALIRNWTPLHIRNVSMLVSLGMVLHAVSLLAFTAFRTRDMLAGFDFSGSEPGLVMAALLTLLISKVVLIWASALWRRGNEIDASWPLYLSVCAVWSFYVGVLV